MHNLDTLPAVGRHSARPGLRTAPTLPRFTAQVESLLGRHDRYHKSSYAGDAAELISRLPEDPYVLAVFMEDHLGYEASAELVKLLTDLWPKWLVLHEMAVVDWAASGKMELLPLGSEIACLSADDQPVRGSIVAVEPAMARYRVQSGDTVFLVNHEDVAPEGTG